MSVWASTIYTPADIVPALTFSVKKARCVIPLAVDLEPEDPQLGSVRLAAKRSNSRNSARFKPGTPGACRIITWMRETDYSKA
jgi:hypothetical protein